ncbi:MAG: accessory Sec-dependent serine-rich glycoprotein adhesin, partial [Clostridia bacterium]|nr:accessory Sec-dependent serine-rich glycoprotein adhesin [Clostridia bacterium]
MKPAGQKGPKMQKNGGFSMDNKLISRRAFLKGAAAAGAVATGAMV